MRNTKVGNAIEQLTRQVAELKAREAKLREAVGRYSTCQRNDGRLLSCARLQEEGETVTFCARCAALAEGEDTPRPEVVEPPIQSVGQEPIKVVNLMEALRRSLDAVLRQDPNMQVRAVRYSAEDK